MIFVPLIFEAVHKIHHIDNSMVTSMYIGNKTSVRCLRHTEFTDNLLFTFASCVTDQPLASVTCLKAPYQTTFKGSLPINKRKGTISRYKKIYICQIVSFSSSFSQIFRCNKMGEDPDFRIFQVIEPSLGVNKLYFIYFYILSNQLVLLVRLLQHKCTLFFYSFNEWQVYYHVSKLFNTTTTSFELVW